MNPYEPSEVIVSHDDISETKQNAKDLYGVQSGR